MVKVALLLPAVAKVLSEVGLAHSETLHDGLIVFGLGCDLYLRVDASACTVRFESEWPLKSGTPTFEQYAALHVLNQTFALLKFTIPAKWNRLKASYTLLVTSELEPQFIVDTCRLFAAGFTAAVTHPSAAPLVQRWPLD